MIKTVNLKKKKWNHKNLVYVHDYAHLRNQKSSINDFIRRSNSNYVYIKTYQSKYFHENLKKNRNEAIVEQV